MSLRELKAFALAAVLFTACVTVQSYYRWRRRAAGHPLPPGPPGWPIIGNILQFPPKGAWVKLLQLKEKYGDVVMLHGAGKYILSLNSMEAVDDLLVKRGEIFSNRPQFTVVSELMGLGQSSPLLPYGPEWRAHRKMMHSVMNTTAVRQYQPVQENLAGLLCSAIADSPKDFFDHARLFAGRVVLGVTYGIPVSAADSEYITDADATMHIVAKANVPGAYLCDIFPIMKHLPSWVPFQKEAAHGRRMIENLVSMPFERVSNEMAEGTALPSLARNLLSLDKEDASLDTHLHRVKWSTGSLYGAGGETTYATVITYIMSMALNPEVQRRAHAELDRVIGSDRLPTIADKANLPYLNAVIQETMRWRPALPIGLPRQTAEDCFYKGYFIPKDTIVVPNAWAIAFKDNDKYDPQAFIPERFLDPNVNVTDTGSWAFGFGRRICPGKPLGENSVFIAITTLCWAFNISAAPGKKIVPAFEDNLISYPKPFECDFKPRSTDRIKLLKASSLYE